MTIAITFISSKDNNEDRIMHLKNDSIEIMTYDKAEEIIEEVFKSLLKRYQIGLEASTKGSDFLFDCVDLLYEECHKIILSCGGSHKYFPDWIKNKKTTINLEMMINAFKCYLLNDEEIGRNL